jgi:hypothetical protein
MSYPFTKPGRLALSVIVLLLLAGGAQAGNFAGKNALYNRDTALANPSSGIVRHERNGDILITPPANALGRYRIRFFDDHKAFLFEIRQIQDPLLIIEKYNFGHAGRYVYELYRDNGLVEKASFQIAP